MEFTKNEIDLISIMIEKHGVYPFLGKVESIVNAHSKSVTIKINIDFEN